MNPTPPKVIGREVCLQIKGLSKLLKDLGVHCKKKQWVLHETNRLEFQKSLKHHSF